MKTTKIIIVILTFMLIAFSFSYFYIKKMLFNSQSKIISKRDTTLRIDPALVPFSGGDTKSGPWCASFVPIALDSAYYSLKKVK